MPPSRWFAVGSPDESELRAGARAAGEAPARDGAKTMVVLPIA
jgi:hypothetical protein